MIKIYGATMSRALRALWTAEEAGLDYEHVDLDFTKGEHRAPGYLKIHPLGKVPALVDGELALTESAAICTYLADKVPAKGLVPEPRSADRARYDQWVAFVISELEQPLWTRAKHTFALPEKLRVPAVRETALKEWQRPAQVMAAALQGRDVLVGDQFSVADILAVHTLNWARAHQVPLGHDALEAYRERHVARPAFRRALGGGAKS
jgi:glutathione S-transferase